MIEKIHQISTLIKSSTTDFLEIAYFL